MDHAGRERLLQAALGLTLGEAENVFAKIIVNPHATAGFPQIYILDPDRHVIEVNAEFLD